MNRQNTFYPMPHHMFYTQLLQQAELHLMHNVQDCLIHRNAGNRWLFRKGMEQGIDHGLRFSLQRLQNASSENRRLTQLLFDHKKEVLETGRMAPHKAIQLWGLTELEDLLDVERESVLCGFDHGLTTVAHTLPKLIKKASPSW